MKKHFIGVMVLALSVLTGCGGSGNGANSFGSTSTQTSTNALIAPSSQTTSVLQTAPGQAALQAFFSASQKYTLNANDRAGNSYTLDLVYNPVAASDAFNGHSDTAAVTSSEVFSMNGHAIIEDVSRSYYASADFTPLGVLDEASGQYQVNQGVALPATLTVGQQGSMGTYTLYHDSSEAFVDATGSISYRVDTYSATQLSLCVTNQLNAEPSNLAGMVNRVEDSCYLISQSGAVTLHSVSIIFADSGMFAFQ